MTLATLPQTNSDFRKADDVLQSKDIIGALQQENSKGLNLTSKSKPPTKPFEFSLPIALLHKPLSTQNQPDHNLLFDHKVEAEKSTTSIATLNDQESSQKLPKIHELEKDQKQINIPTSPISISSDTNSEQSPNLAIIPKTIIATPCGFNGTYSDGYTGCFEGPEKLLEIWFNPDISSLANLAPSEQGLRSIPRPDLERMLSLVHCSVLDSFSNDHLDSYLLSESSMFVFPSKIILKTCGTTTLLLALNEILVLAKRYCGFTSVRKIFYSRKSFMFPDKQPVPHNSWANEVDYLDSYFHEGKSYIIGDLNSEYWHLYVASNPTIKVENLSARSNIVDQSLANHIDYEQNEVNQGQYQDQFLGIEPEDEVEDEVDITVEILMTGLDQEKMEIMYCDCIEGAQEGLNGGKIIENACGLSSIYPEATSASYLFSPCGLSSNGLLNNNYFTVHITPEQSCSYASFETNIPISPISSTRNSRQTKNTNTNIDINQLVNKVVGIFAPKQFTVTVFYTANLLETPHISSPSSRGTQSQLQNNWAYSFKDFSVSKTPKHYKPADKILYEIDDYHLRYYHFTKI